MMAAALVDEDAPAASLIDVHVLVLDAMTSRMHDAGSGLVAAELECNPILTVVVKAALAARRVDECAAGKGPLHTGKAVAAPHAFGGNHRRRTGHGLLDVLMVAVAVANGVNEERTALVVLGGAIASDVMAHRGVIVSARTLLQAVERGRRRAKFADAEAMAWTDEMPRLLMLGRRSVERRCARDKGP